MKPSFTLSFAFTVFLLLGIDTRLEAQTPVIQVTLLGTGVPLLNAVGYVQSGRVMAGTLVVAGSERFLFDVGAGVVNRLYQSSSNPANPNIAVDKVFLTHLHSDHIADLASLYSVGWLYRDPLPLRVWGPGKAKGDVKGVKEIMDSLRETFAADIYFRSTPFLGFECCTFTANGVDIKDNVTEIDDKAPTDIVYSNNGVIVRAFRVEHDPVSPAYGYRIEYKGKSVMITGDTTYTQNLVQYGTNADVIISEAWGWARMDGEGLYDYHCPPESCLAPMFLATAPKLAVLTHLSGPPPVDGVANDIINRTRTSGYHGPLVGGVDLMNITVHSVGAPVVTTP